MLKREITFTDMNGNDRTRTYYFHIFDNELIDMELSDDGFASRIKAIAEEQDPKKLIGLIQWFVLKSYGVKDDDGLTFEKTEAITNKFKCSPAYEALWRELLLDDRKAADFINGLFPPERLAAIQKLVGERREELEKSSNQPILPEQGGTRFAE